MREAEVRLAQVAAELEEAEHSLKLAKWRFGVHNAELGQERELLEAAERQ